MNDNSKQFTDGEKLITMMLCDLYKHFKVKGVIDPKFIEEVMSNGYYWALGYEYSGIFDDEITNPKDVKETVDILNMWRFIQNRYKALSEEDKIKVKKETNLNDEDFKFEGFDANNDPHYFIANFLIEKLNRFTDITPINSHSAASLELYNRMLPVYKDIVINRRNESETDQIINIFNAKTKVPGVDKLPSLS